MKKSEMHYVTCGEMKLLERRADERGLSYYQMMENAGTEAFEVIRAKTSYHRGEDKCRALVFCGKGNNGGDGFVVARLLSKAGCYVRVVLADGEPKTTDAVTNYGLIRKMNLEMINLAAENQQLTQIKMLAEIIVDAIYGTGFHGKLKGNGLRSAMYIDKCRQQGSQVFALDIPSGMGGDMTDSRVFDRNAVKADTTITFHARKPVHMQDFAKEYCGEIVVADIGINEVELMNPEVSGEIDRILNETHEKEYCFQDFVEIIKKLRAPGGCPWDREQTHKSLRKHLIEESNEVIEAIDEGDSAHICEELGDVLLQVVLYAQIAKEAGEFDIEDVIQGVSEKMIRRHPHVFGDIQISSDDEGLSLWEEIKRREKATGK